MNKNSFLSLLILTLLQCIAWADYNQSRLVGQKINFSKTELAYIQKLPTLRYSGDPDWMPYESFTNDGSHIGVTADVLKILTERIDIQLTKVHPASWSDAVNMMKIGSIDMFSDTDDSVLNKDMMFTKPYLSDRIVIVSRNVDDTGLGIDDIRDKRIAVVKDYGYVNALRQKYPELKFMYFNTIMEAFTAVQEQRADYTVAGEYEAARMVFLKFDHLHISGETGTVTNLAFAFNPKYKELVPIFNKAIDTLTDEDRVALKNSWLPSKIVQDDHKQIIYISLFFTFLLLVAFFIYRNLKKELDLRKQLQLDLTREKNNFETLFKTSADANAILLNKRFFVCNQAFLDLFKYSYDEVMGKRPDQLSPLHQPDGELSTQKMEKVLASMMSKGKARFEWVHEDSSGTVVWCDIVLTKIVYNGVLGIFAQIRNIDDIKILEASLVDLKIKAEQANQAKSQFLANMSHEIRTPMNAVLGFAELLEKSDGLAPAQMNYVRSIKNGAKNLLAIINDILDLSKIEAGKLQIKKEPVDIMVVIEDIKSVFEPLVTGKNLIFDIDYPSDMPKIWIIDDIRLRQILFNLLGNAIKFTEHGKISFGIRVNHLDPSKQVADISLIVEDTGIGVSADDQVKIFQEFSQSDQQNTRKYGGTGLGLTISRKLADGMGATLTLESEKGKGSRFTVRFYSIAFEMDAIISEGSHQQLQYRFDKATILSVDDVEENLLLLRAMLSEHPFTIIDAHNGEEALEQLASRPFDLVISDIRMPVMDGYGLKRRMEQDERWKKIPVIAVTASVLDDERNKLMESGFKGVLLKPYQMEQLEQIISLFVSSTQEEKIIESATSEEPLQLEGTMRQRYKELYGERIMQQSKRNNFSEMRMLVDDLRIFSHEYDNRSFERVLNALEIALREFDVMQVNAIFNALIDNLKE